MIDEEFIAIDLLDLSDLKSNIYQEQEDLETTVYPQREPANLEQNLEINEAIKVRLALEELNCFEVVENQFESWGITFDNAIALEPSNPAFVIKPSTTVIMAAPKGGHLEVNFKHPVQKVSGLITSSRATVLSAYDSEGNKVAESTMSVSPHINSHTLHFPNAQLEVSGSNIQKVTFETFDGQLILHHFQVEFEQ